MTTEEAKNLKIGDRLEMATASWLMTGTIAEINPAGQTDTCKIRWDNGNESTYDIQTLVRNAKLLPLP